MFLIYSLSSVDSSNVSDAQKLAQSALLPAGENRYLAAVAPGTDCFGLAWVDVSTGEFATTELIGARAGFQLRDELARLSPAECLLPDDALPESVGSVHV